MSIRYTGGGNDSKMIFILGYSEELVFRTQLPILLLPKRDIISQTGRETSCNPIESINARCVVLFVCCMSADLHAVRKSLASCNVSIFINPKPFFVLSSFMFRNGRLRGGSAMYCGGISLNFAVCSHY